MCGEQHCDSQRGDSISYGAAAAGQPTADLLTPQRNTATATATAMAMAMAMAMAIDARSGARRARISCFIPMPILVLLVCAAAAARAEPGAEPGGELLYDSSRNTRSASQTFLQLISGYESADDDWTLRSLFSAPRPAPARRRDSLRVSSLPVLLLPVPVHDLQQYDPYNVRPSRRRLVPEHDGEESPEPPRRGSWAPPLAADARGATPLDDSFDEDAASHSRSGAPREQPAVLPIESSQRLVEMFRAQEARDADAPAVLQSEFDGSERVLLPDADDDDDDEAPEARSARTVRALPAGAGAQGGRALPAGAGAQAGRALPTGAGATSRARSSPARPRFARPLKLRAVLTVPRAGYSEAYTAWWDPSSGDSRVHFQGGSAVTFRKMLPHGLVRKIEMHVDRADGRVLRRCARADAVASAADRANPALPDLQLFTFVGYEEDGAERWQHRVEGAAGEAGGARGEALTVRHELLLLRDRDDSAIPLRYSVAVDSSVLGADCDGYHHTYLETRYHNRGPEFFEVNLDEICDEVKRLNASEPEERARLEPLREFTLPRRDPRYDALLERFKERNERRYVDDAEEAVRKNLVMQSSRFVSSGNRAGATFQLGLNFLGDRLDAELSGLGGVARDSERSRAERFPHARPALHAAERRLPDAFDWRARGGVSPVRYQGASCASCWAFATVGAVEGTLFRRSGRLTPLSEQQLVDCAHPFGGNGCRGTWPSRAYDYVQERGLAALDDYVPYRGEVESCKEESVRPVTRISGHVNVTKHSVPALKVAIRQHGPAVVIVDSSPKSFTLYSKGVLYDDRCSKKSSKHAVLAVGWGQEKGEPYFILKNSWSEVWGEHGYVRVQARANTCGVLTHPSYPRLEDDDVLQR